MRGRQRSRRLSSGGQAFYAYCRAFHAEENEAYTGAYCAFPALYPCHHTHGRTSLLLRAATLYLRVHCRAYNSIFSRLYTCIATILPAMHVFSTPHTAAPLRIAPCVVAGLLLAWTRLRAHSGISTPSLHYNITATRQLHLPTAGSRITFAAIRLPGFKKTPCTRRAFLYSLLLRHGYLNMLQRPVSLRFLWHFSCTAFSARTALRCLHCWCGSSHRVTTASLILSLLHLFVPVKHSSYVLMDLATISRRGFEHGCAATSSLSLFRRRVRRGSPLQKPYQRTTISTAPP